MRFATPKGTARGWESGKARNKNRRKSRRFDKGEMAKNAKRSRNFEKNTQIPPKNVLKTLDMGGGGMGYNVCSQRIGSLCGPNSEQTFTTKNVGTEEKKTVSVVYFAKGDLATLANGLSDGVAKPAFAYTG